jgi:hypothetical protein
MTKINPIHCTYCGSVSEWSAETTDSTELGEPHVCAGCEEVTSVWDDTDTQKLDHGELMEWVSAEPLY